MKRAALGAALLLAQREAQQAIAESFQKVARQIEERLRAAQLAAEGGR